MTMFGAPQRAQCTPVYFRSTSWHNPKQCRTPSTPRPTPPNGSASMHGVPPPKRNPHHGPSSTPGTSSPTLAKSRPGQPGTMQPPKSGATSSSPAPQCGAPDCWNGPPKKPHRHPHCNNSKPSSRTLCWTPRCSSPRSSTSTTGQWPAPSSKPAATAGRPEPKPKPPPTQRPPRRDPRQRRPSQNRHHPNPPPRLPKQHPTIGTKPPASAKPRTQAPVTTEATAPSAVAGDTKG